MSRDLDLVDYPAEFVSSLLWSFSLFRALTCIGVRVQRDSCELAYRERPTSNESTR